MCLIVLNIKTRPMHSYDLQTHITENKLQYIQLMF